MSTQGDHILGVVVVPKVELSLTRTAHLARRGLQTVQALDEVERLFEAGRQLWDVEEFERAAGYFRRVLELRPTHVEAHFKLAACLVMPLINARTYVGLAAAGCEAIQEAFHHFYIAALADHPEGQGFVAYMLRDGDGVTQNEALAFFWMNQAARHGHPGLQFQVGRMYEQGRGVERDMEQAAYWYHLSAAQLDVAKGPR